MLQMSNNRWPQGGIPNSEGSELVNKKASMSVEMAIRLSKNFASSPET